MVRLKLQVTGSSGQDRCRAVPASLLWESQYSQGEDRVGILQAGPQTNPELGPPSFPHRLAAYLSLYPALPSNLLSFPLGHFVYPPPLLSPSFSPC